MCDLSLSFAHKAQPRRPPCPDPSLRQNRPPPFFEKQNRRILDHFGGMGEVILAQMRHKILHHPIGPVFQRVIDLFHIILPVRRYVINATMTGGFVRIGAKIWFFRVWLILCYPMAETGWAKPENPPEHELLPGWGQFSVDANCQFIHSTWVHGDVAEWLRSGLQIRVHRFDSGRRLHTQFPPKSALIRAHA